LCPLADVEDLGDAIPEPEESRDGDGAEAVPLCAGREFKLPELAPNLLE